MFTFVWLPVIRCNFFDLLTMNPNQLSKHFFLDRDVRNKGTYAYILQASLANPRLFTIKQGKKALQCNRKRSYWNWKCY